MTTNIIRSTVGVRTQSRKDQSRKEGMEDVSITPFFFTDRGDGAEEAGGHPTLFCRATGVGVLEQKYEKGEEEEASQAGRQAGKMKLVRIMVAG